ncbi:hypothetical protein L1D14_07680 [Vibrio tubiashii]|uniref:hypothetical protein n=1 Tax=Vibrio tubiashii TaxID=29498 RepID=UPI001EFD430A|nr:hypothetical protein [Vibrio tubiashii]MCG9576119.1 hypothetical protein [Vibrio tubiashii]
MNRRTKLILALLSLCIPFSKAYAADSTSTPINNLTQSQTFSSAGTVTKRYSGSTTGRIPIAGGKEVTVNGINHARGLGLITTIPVTETVTVTTRCYDSTGKYNTCDVDQVTVDVTCNIIITDGYAQGCSKTVSNRNYHCFHNKFGGDDYRHTCELRSTAQVGVRGYVQTVFEKN